MLLLRILGSCVALFVVSFGSGNFAFAAEKAADYVLTNGKVYTVNDGQPWAEAVAISGSDITYVGNNAGAQAFIGGVKNLDRARQLLCVPTPRREPDPIADADEPPMLSYPCPSCGGPMIVIETFERGSIPRAPPPAPSAGDRS